MRSPAAASGEGGDVVGERPEQVALDRREGSPGEADGVDCGTQVASHECEVAGFDRDVGAGSHRETEVGLGESGGVVDSVADHRDDSSFVLEASYDVDLLGGEDLGDDLVDADLGGDISGGAFVVAGEEHRAETESAETGDRFG